MSARKNRLLHSHRRRKRLVLGGALLLLVSSSVFGPGWLAPLLALLGWIAHEAWFADHLFYSPGDDYRYAFPAGTPSCGVRLDNGLLRLDGELPVGETLMLALHVRTNWLGRWLDPQVWVGDDPQTFERGTRGLRYLNLSGQGLALRKGELRLRGRFCRLPDSGTLHVFAHPDYAHQPLMILAPHADDAELAAFGQYSRSPAACIVTLTQGEVEARVYQRLGLARAAAARLKGRLRSWDSLAIPLWGGVPQSRCVQLGYYCLQLQAMAGEPDKPFGSRESGETDIRSVRGHNPLLLPGDADGQPRWSNLVADLVVLLEHFRPALVVTPHPELDPHPDHVATSRALQQAVALSRWKPALSLLYANHLHDNDRWPMGPAGSGITLPPAFGQLPVDALWSPLLSAETRLDKALALAMQHDLQGRLPLKQRLRRQIQRLLVGRRWPATGDDEFQRKAVRRHELFWVRAFEPPAVAVEPQAREEGNVAYAAHPPAL